MTKAARRRRVPLGMLIALTAVLPVLSCGGNSSVPASVVPPGVCLDFSAASAPEPGAVVASEGGATSCDRLALELIITDVDDVFAAEFTIGFNPAVLGYDDHDERDSVLASDGTTVAVVEDPQSGLVQLTITRLGAAVGGMDVAGSQLLIRLDFVREAESGTSQLAFSDTRVWNGNVPPDEIPGIEWHGGSVTIR